MLLVVTAIVSLQFGAAFGATLFDEVGAAGATLLRLGFAAALALAIWRPRPAAHPAGDLRLAALFGLVLGVMNLSIYSAIERIPIGVAVTIEFVGPLGVAVAASRRPLDVVWVLLAAAGILGLADLGGGGTDAAGVGLALLAGACWAAYILLSQRAGQRFSGASGLAMAMAVSVVVPLAPGIAQGGADLLDPRLLAVGAAVGLLSSVIPYALEMEALRRMARGPFGVLMSLEPGVAALAGLVVLGQRLSASDLVAIALVVVACAGATRSGARLTPRRVSH